MTLTPQELAFLDRFCYEVDHFLHGTGSVFEQCPGHYRDLGALTNFAPKEIYQKWMLPDRLEPQVAPFPWQSLEEIRTRLAALELVGGAVRG
jgi:hypothetical protein